MSKFTTDIDIDATFGGAITYRLIVDSPMPVTLDDIAAHVEQHANDEITAAIFDHMESIGEPAESVEFELDCISFAFDDNGIICGVDGGKVFFQWFSKFSRFNTVSVAEADRSEAEDKYLRASLEWHR